MTLTDSEKLELKILIATCDEDEIEKSLHSRFLAYALRHLDKLQIKGIYETTRAELMHDADVKQRLSILRRFSQAASGITVDKELIEFGWQRKALENYYDGLSSPDEDQRRRFDEADRFIKEHRIHPAQIMPLLQCFEKSASAPKTRGRRPRSRGVIGPLNPDLRQVDKPLLIRMKILCAKGATPHAASRDVLREPGSTINESHADRLENTFRQKMALRTFPAGFK